LRLHGRNYQQRENRRWQAKMAVGVPEMAGLATAKGKDEQNGNGKELDGVAKMHGRECE